MMDHSPQLPIISFFFYIMGLSLYVLKAATAQVWTFLINSGFDESILNKINDYTETLANILMVISFLVVIAMNMNTLKRKLFNKDEDQ